MDSYLQSRLRIRDSGTVSRERNTLLRFFRWAVIQNLLPESPAALLEPIPSGTDRPPFRTLDEIKKILQRGGMEPPQQSDLWECLYLAPSEIAGLLNIIRERAQFRVSYFLHAIPAYTGMRRGEVLRLTWVDVDLEEGAITARSQNNPAAKRKRDEELICTRNFGKNCNC